MSKENPRRTVLCMLALLPAVFAVLIYSAQSERPAREEQWKSVHKAIREGLPRTAMQHLEPIIKSALEDSAHAEAVRAIAQKVALEGNIQGNKPEEKIVMFEAEMADVPDEMRPVMQAILANWYWHFFQHNRWRFMQRTATGEAPGDDITAWDLARIFAEIDKQFTLALDAKDMLRETPIEDYDALLVKGSMPDSYRPTLYDFVAAEAIRFYSSGEQAAARPQDAFVLAADSAIFAPRGEFIRWEAKTTDADSPLYKAVLLYQEMLSFHREYGNLDALIDHDLDRLRFGYNHAVGEEKNELYKAALHVFIDQWSDHAVSARARHDLASVLKEEGDLVEARKVALRGRELFPDSPGARLCSYLIRRIELPHAYLNAERVWNDPRQEIEINYKNLTKAYFRLVPWDWEEVLEQFPDRHPEQSFRQRTLNEKILNAEPAHEWSAELPATDDYHMRSEKVLAPDDLTPGFYWLVSAHDPEFKGRGSVVSIAPVWVSDLALIWRHKSGSGEMQGLVLDARSGSPIDGVQVRIWGLAQTWRKVELREYETVRTDEMGVFRIKEHGGSRLHVALAGEPGRQVATAGQYTAWSRAGDGSFQRTVFFTDRSIYRPGQTIHYKGICIDVDHRRDDYEVLPNRTVTVRFMDANNREIARQQVRTNDYGSFSGSFTAPRDRLTGRMSIRSDSPAGHASVNVEEYKRPTFRVALDAPSDAPRLNDTVNLTGTATAYTGAPTDGARVRWRVVRQTRYPRWWLWQWHWRRWRAGPASREEQEIAHGTAVTEVDGTFTIEFTARPDPAAEEEGDPTFQFTVYADVTDAAGETRSDRRIVNVGFTALSASLSAHDWLAEDEPFDIAIRTASLDGEGQPAEGTLRVYRLVPPDSVMRAALERSRHYLPADRSVRSDQSDPAAWPPGVAVAEREFATDPGGHAAHRFTLEAGAYRAVLETRDRFGKAVRAELPLRVLDPGASRLAIKMPHLLDAPAWSVEPGEEFKALWGSGYDSATALIEIEHRGRLLQRYWTDPERTQIAITQDVTEQMRGGFFVHVTMVRENRAYIESRHVDVPWSNKKLDIAWERFTSKLDPGQSEKWTAIISGPDAEETVAEMVATLYDKSLDAFLPHNWTSGFGVFRRDWTNISSNFENSMQPLIGIRGSWPWPGRHVTITYRSFPREIIANLWGYGFYRGRRDGVDIVGLSAPQERMAMADGFESREMLSAEAPAEATVDADKRAEEAEPDPLPDIDLDHVTARKILDETAFFFPHLVSGEDGKVRMEFTMPEALTEWKFMGFAHDAELRAGLLTGSTVTAKDLMVQPNPPRFLREGDVLEFTVRVTNQSDARQEGVVRLNFLDARTLDSFDEAMANLDTEKSFDVPAKESRTYSWRIEVPDRPGILIYRAVGSTGQLSDGEEGYLPVLSRRIMITESLPLPVRGPETKRFDFDKLLRSGEMETLESKTLTLQMVSNPAWYAVMALPYLMEYPHRSADRVFHRLYANELAGHIANSDPKIRRIFDQWKGTDALDSPLEKNEDLKAVVLEETPWVRQAESESQARRNVGILFDHNRLDEERGRALHQLTQMQLADGSWPWFPGGRPNTHITLCINSGFGRLRHLGVDIDVSPAVRALQHLDNWMRSTYEIILQTMPDPEKYIPSPMIALYLSSRTFFLEDRPVGDEHRVAFEFFIERAKEHWLKVPFRKSQAHMALALHRLGERDSARAIMRSIKERSVTDEELGMFWRELELSWWWFRAPIETQAMMIEAFDEVMNDAEAVEDCRVWLLKQKQTQDWKTTRATADAVYALLLRGYDMLASDELVEVSLADMKLEPEDVEAGAGFYEKRFTGPEIQPEMGAVTVTKHDEGVAWGGLHWQYLEDIANITPHSETPLTLEKALYIKRHTGRGPVLEKVDGPVEVGDELVSRIVLRTDRDMEYVHLKDYRGSGTEPVSVLSRYRYQDGLRYYESTRDAASHFFIDYLPKGTYVFEYSVRVQHRGSYQTGIAQVQCMYAPEFNSHSESFELEVR